MSPAHKRSLITWVAGLSFAFVLSFYILGWYLLGLLAVASVWGCYSSLPAVGPRPQLNLSRIKAFLLGTRWVEAVHDQFKAGSGQWKARGRAGRGRPQQGLGHPGKAPGNSCRWEANCEECRPPAASERSPAELMMGSYLSKENTAFSSRELRSRYHRPNPVPSPTKRLSFGKCPKIWVGRDFLDSQAELLKFKFKENKEEINREHQVMINKFTVVPRRRYPIHQPQYSIPGTLPTVRWDGYQKKNVLSSRNSIMVHSPVTVKIARPDANIIHSPLLDQMMSPAVSPSMDPCSKATVLNALKESRKRMVEDDTERSLISEHENKRRRHDSSGSGHSAFEPLLANGAPASLVPKPGTLKRGTHSQCSDDPISKRSRTSSISSLSSLCVGGKHSSIRNPIFSSYSSTRGQVQGLKSHPSVRNPTPLSSPASSRSETPEKSSKKIREEEIQRSNASTPVRVDKSEKDQPTEEEIVTPLSKLSPSTVDSSPLEGNGKRKRKIPLLAKRKGDPLTLHPPIELGYTITADDMDCEKRARLDKIKKVLQEKEEPSNSSEPVITAPSVSTFTTPVVESSADSTSTCTSISAIVSNPLLDSLKMMQDHTNVITTSDSVNEMNPSNTVKTSEASAKTFKGELLLPSPTPLPPTTATTMATDVAGFKPVDVVKFSCPSITQSLVTPINKPVPKAITTTTNSCQVSVLVSAQESKLSKGPEINVPPCTGNSSPSTNFILSSTVAAIPTGISTTAPSSVIIPEFKPVFGLPVTQQAIVTAATLSSGVPLTAPISLAAPITSSSATSIMPFKPVFGNSVTLTTAATTSAPFNFGQSVQATKNNEAPPPTNSTKSNATLFQFGAPSVLTNSSIDSEVKCTKAAISFGLNENVASKPNIAPTASNNLASQQQFQFGSNPTTTTTTAAPSTVFQFGKSSADVTATAAGLSAAVFGQSKVVPSQASSSIATTSNLFGNFTPSVSTPSTTSSAQLTHAFGNSGKTSLFGNSTSTPPFGGLTTQLNFESTSNQLLFGANATATQQTPSKPPAFGNIVTPFNFGATPTKPTFQSTTSQSAFGTPSQPVFGSATAQTGFGSTSTQPTFGGTSVGFSFGTTTSSTAAPMFSTTKSSGSGTTGSIFGSAQGVAFGSSNQPVITTNVVASNANIATAGFFGSSQSGFCASNPSVPFATSTPTSSSSQNLFGPSLTNQGTQNQSTPQFNFGAVNTVENKSAFGGFNFGTPSLNFGTGSTALGFGQSTPSANFSFGTTSTPASNFGSPGAGAASAFAATPSFSIGAGSRSTGGRQRLQARRQHVRKR